MWRRQTEKQIRVSGRNPATGRAHNESLLDQVRLDHVLDRAALLAHGRGKAFDADRTAVEFFNDRSQQAPVHGIEAIWIDLEHIQCTHRHLLRDNAVGLHLGIVPYTP